MQRAQPTFGAIADRAITVLARRRNVALVVLSAMAIVGAGLDEVFDTAAVPGNTLVAWLAGRPFEAFLELALCAARLEKRPKLVVARTFSLAFARGGFSARRSSASAS